MYVGGLLSFLERSERTVFQVECDVEEVCFIPILTDIFRPTFILSKE